MLTKIAIATASIGIFSVMLWLIGIVSEATKAMATARGALDSLRDPRLEDEAREGIVQKSAIKLVVTCGSLVLRSLITLAAGAVPILLADWADLISQAAMLDFLERWDVIVTATLVVTLGYYLGVRLWPR